jgi:hypothetical protein
MLPRSARGHSKMTQVAVKESHPSVPPPSLMRRVARRVLRKRVLAAFGGAIALVALLHWVVLPWLVRDRVRAVLDEAGLGRATFRVTRATPWATEIRDLELGDGNRVDRVKVRYDVQDLTQREVDEIIVTGATLAADPRNWPIEKKQSAATTRATTSTTRPKQPPIELPFDRLRFEDSQIVLGNGRKVPFDAALLRTAKHYSFRLKSAEVGLDVHGTLARNMDSGRVIIDAQKVPGDLIGDVLRTYVDDAAVEIGGQASGQLAAAWDQGGVRATASLEISGGSIDDASDAKLTLGSGVLVGEMNVGPSTRPTIAVKADRVDLATPDLKAYGVGGAVSLINLAPPTSAPRQNLSAQRLTIGETEFTNGQLEFELTETGDILVRQTRWDFLGGQVYAQDVSVPRDGPVTLRLRAVNVELHDILVTYAKDKLDGRGRISGELPVVIDGRNITFGEGALVSLGGGELRITDPKTLAQVSEAAGQGVAVAAGAATGGASADQVKQLFAEALRDFEYDHLSARLTNPPGGGLSALIDIQGHGRTGAKQALRYEPRIHGLDQLLRLYLDLRDAEQHAGGAGGAGGKRPATTTTTGKVDPK